MEATVKYKFGWMSIFFSPFKSPRPIFYIGKVAIGTPYMLPRVWRKSEDGKNMTHSPRKFGFDFVPLGYKCKWESLRAEWNPVWSFVIWNFQIAIVWHLPTQHWESYLTYKYKTDTKLPKLKRLEESRYFNPNIWFTYTTKGKKIRKDYFINSLKKRWNKKITQGTRLL